MPLDVVRAGSVLVVDHLLGLVRDGVVDLLERLLRSEQVVLFQELATLLGQSVELLRVPLPALVIVEGDLFDDTRVDELLHVFVDSCLAHAGVELLELVHRGELFGVLEDVGLRIACSAFGQV